MEDQTTEEQTPKAEAPQPRTTKQRVIDARGQEVPLDYFLYSCLEHERLEKAKRRANPAAHPEWTWPLLQTAPALDVADGETPPPAPVHPEVASGSIDTLLAKVFAWYKETFPLLAGSVAIDHERLHQIAPGVVALSRDIEHLYRTKLGSSLPTFERNTTNPVWADLERLFVTHFPSYKHLFLRYLQWSHSTEPSEEFEPGSRPPVGRYMPPPLPRTGTRDRGGRDSFGSRGGPPERGNRGGPSSSRPSAPRSTESQAERPSPAPEAEHQETGSHQDSDGNRAEAPSSRPPREGNRAPREPRPEGGRPPRRDERGPRRPRSEDDEHTARQTAAAMTEVESAIGTLQGDASVQEVTLKPTNSFYRRLQHQKIVDAGFQSQSVGEGPDRAVRITR